MAKQLTENTLMQALNWTYEKAVDGIPGLGSAEEMGQDYLNGSGLLVDKVNSLIRWQNSKAAVSGFINGLGGAPFMPITIPANITTVMYVQVRMIAAIAYMGGYNLNDDRVKSLVYICLCGNTAKDVAKEIGIKVGTKMTEQAIKNISTQLIVRINQAVGFRLLTKFGQTGAINLVKAIPGVAGIVGAAFDSTATNAVGNVARNTFIGGK